ncbi:hypothetical protein BDV25DRAFT_71729 [Aspergillus avenaceus]|uniref:Uncharacterized protein n=1 Tax=Aspergillus avenaceus TaxID=36643 RepID=A0A5N6U146_ASPAV|nr:hypothetical protein BDV25DRAFT_71729 [Aspergillus avenaceus]
MSIFFQYIPRTLLQRTSLQRTSLQRTQPRSLFPRTRNLHSTMPLVVPEVKGDKFEWLSKLAGKQITESTSDVSSFSKKDLPEPHRIVKPDSMKTMDHKPERMNIHVDENDTVHDITFG